MKNAHDVITCKEIVTGTMAHGKVNIIKKNPEQSSTWKIVRAIFHL